MSTPKSINSVDGKYKFLIGTILFIGGGLFAVILQIMGIYHRLDAVGISPFKLTVPVWFMLVGGILLVGLTVVKMWNTFKGRS